MEYRTFPGTAVPPISAVGFGLWTVSTGWWGSFTDEEATSLMRQALDLGINFFDAADTYGNGRSETLLAKAFPKTERDRIVIATKVGYNFYDHGTERRGQREIPHDFSVPFIRTAVEKALQRIDTDHIDLLQLHNIRLEQIADDALWHLLEDLKTEGKILAYGAALGPAIGWLYEGIDCIRERHPHVLQHIYNLFEPYPGREIMGASSLEDPTRYLIRVTHSSGLLEGRYTADTTFPSTDHRSHRPRSWLLNGIQKVDNIRFLETPERTLGQAALLWLLKDKRIASTLPNIYTEEQLREFATATECPALSDEEMRRLEELATTHFGVPDPPDSPPKFKGTMTR